MVPHRQANKSARFERLFHDKLLGPPGPALGHLRHCLELPTKEMFSQILGQKFII